MPEGDTYARAATRVRPVLVGYEIERVEGSAPAVRRHSARITGQRVEHVRTVGKRLIFDLEGDRSIVIRLGMSGSVQVTGSGRRAGDGVRLALTTSTGSVHVVGAPDVEVVRTKELRQDLERLGPDLLGPEFDWDRFEALASRYPPERTVSDFLLDQRVMAGIGNEYKSEVLFLERIDPRRPMGEVDGATRWKLAERARRLMTPNVARIKRTTAGRGEGSLWVYGRGGQPCLRCRTAIDSDWIGDPIRITYWCPVCQA